MFHRSQFRVYNLCQEKPYDASNFENRVCKIPFKDHEAPRFVQIYQFCEDIDNWLKMDPQHIAAVHCKAGKGRTGLMVCCYLIYSHYENLSTPDDIIKFYGIRRTNDYKVPPLAFASQSSPPSPVYDLRAPKPRTLRTQLTRLKTGRNDSEPN